MRSSKIRTENSCMVGEYKKLKSDYDELKDK